MSLLSHYLQKYLVEHGLRLVDRSGQLATETLTANLTTATSLTVTESYSFHFNHQSQLSYEVQPSRERAPFINYLASLLFLAPQITELNWPDSDTLDKLFQRSRAFANLENLRSLRIRTLDGLDLSRLKNLHTLSLALAYDREIEKIPSIITSYVKTIRIFLPSTATNQRAAYQAIVSLLPCDQVIFESAADA